MKIEIGESLAYSWLRHVKGCQVVQNNWKVSPKWTTYSDSVQEMVKDVRKLSSKPFENISFEQIIAQTECDAVGVRFEKDVCTYYMVEVAYHRDGLLYTNKETTAKKIVEKMVRSAICLMQYFNTNSGELIFASPKVGNATEEEINGKLEELNDHFEKKGYNFKVQLYFNQKFNEEILKKVIDMSKEIKDTSELFMRSYQLMDIFENKN